MKTSEELQQELYAVGSSVYQQPGNQSPTPGSESGPIRVIQVTKVEMMLLMQTLRNQRLEK